MKLQTKNLIADVLILALSGVWIFWLFSDYFSKQLLYGVALKKFPYLNYMAGIALLAGLNAGLYFWGKSKNRLWMMSGAWLVLQGILVVVLTTQAVFDVAIEPLNRSGRNFENRPLSPLIHLFTGIAGPTFFLIVAFSTGDFLLDLLKTEFKKADRAVIALMTGFGVWMTLLFGLGAIHALQTVVLLLLGLGVIIIRYKTTGKWLKNVLITPQVKFASKLNVGGLLSLFAITMLVSINLMRVQMPFPTGSDALNYYINLARLIGNEHGLVRGFQPHNYSLITSLGYTIGSGTPSALVFSLLGGVLSLPVLYRIGRSVIKMSPNTALFALLLIYLTPTIVVQSIAELKIDLGLLFMSSATLLLFYYIVQDKPKELSERIFLMVLLGLCCGWLLGVKLTSIFLVFALICGLWYHRAGLLGFGAAGFLSLGFSLVSGVDRLYEIDVAHLSRSFVLGVVMAVGLALTAVIFIRKRDTFQLLFKESIVVALFTLLAFSPWLVKNYQETKRLDSRFLMQGALPGKDLNLPLMLKNMGDE